MADGRTLRYLGREISSVNTGTSLWDRMPGMEAKRVGSARTETERADDKAGRRPAIQPRGRKRKRGRR